MGQYFSLRFDLKVRLDRNLTVKDKLAQLASKRKKVSRTKVR